MSDLRVSRDALASLVREASRQLEKAAGTPVGKQAEAILSQLTESAFQETAGAGKLPDRMPSTMQALGTQLKALGIDAATVGEVLNRLAEQMAGLQRRMRPGRTLKAAAGRQAGLLEEALADSENAEELREAMDHQADAAELMARLDEARDLAKKGRFGKV